MGLFVCRRPVPAAGQIGAKTTMRTLSHRRQRLLGGCLLGLTLLAGACGRQPDPAPVSTQPPAATQGVQAPAADTPAALPAGSAGDWTVEIVQGDLVSEAGMTDVTLARAPFTIRVRMDTPQAVKINALDTDANFIAIQPGYTFTADCVVALCTGMDVAEDRLNPQQMLFVDPLSTHYLYYQSPEDHRWSRAEVTADGAVFERDVALLNDQPVEQYPSPALFLLMFVNDSNPEVVDEGELRKITLLFQ
jgi:hypothetical protein